MSPSPPNADAPLPPHDGADQVDGVLELAIEQVRWQGRNLSEVKGRVEFGPRAARVAKFGGRAGGQGHEVEGLDLTPEVLRGLDAAPQLAD